MPGIVELSLPALFAAGLVASPHCALMCGALNDALLREHGGLTWREAQWLTNAGRLAGYGLLGALAGAFGGALLRLLPDPGAGRFVQALAALALVVIGIRQLLPVRTVPACCAQRTSPPPRWPARIRLLLRGVAWAAVPCGLLYGVLVLAAFSTSALHGAALMVAFGLGTSPLLWASAGALERLRGGRRDRVWRIGAGVALVLLGIAAAAAALAQHSSLLAWCRSLA